MDFLCFYTFILVYCSLILALVKTTHYDITWIFLLVCWICCLAISLIIAYIIILPILHAHIARSIRNQIQIARLISWVLFHLILLILNHIALFLHFLRKWIEIANCFYLITFNYLALKNFLVFVETCLLLSSTESSFYLILLFIHRLFCRLSFNWHFYTLWKLSLLVFSFLLLIYMILINWRKWRGSSSACTSYSFNFFISFFSKISLRNSHMAFTYCVIWYGRSL